MRHHKGHIAHSILLLTAICCLTACSDRQEQPTARHGRLHLVLGAATFGEAPTRALPEHFVTYSDLYAASLPEHAQIEGFMAEAGEAEPIRGQFSFTDHSSRTWTSYYPVETDGTYYFYGIIPKEDAGDISIAPYHGNYLRGAVITMNGLQAISSSDICTVVGVRDHTDGTTPIASLDMASRLGSFNFTTTDYDDNYLYLLLDHLYCRLHFEMRVSDDYSQLRTIKLKQLRLTATDGTDAVGTVRATVTLTATDGTVNPLSAEAGGSVAFTTDGSTATTRPLLLWDNATVPVVLSSTPTGFPDCYAADVNQTFVLESVYDVYDRKGNLIRANQTAHNSFRPASMTPGKQYTYAITVTPTYLYLLSDPDLDNPTFTME